MMSANLRAGRQELILHDDELDAAFVSQNLGAAIDVGVLIDEDVAGDGVDQLDVVVQPIGPDDAIG